MLEGPKELRFYRMLTGKQPFRDWFVGLDEVARIPVIHRLDRLARGHLGDFDTVGGGVLEMRIHRGPGYRIYIAPALNDLVIVLMGGTKREQPRDIGKAVEYAKDYRLRGLWDARIS